MTTRATRSTRRSLQEAAPSGRAGRRPGGASASPLREDASPSKVVTLKQIKENLAKLKDMQKAKALAQQSSKKPVGKTSSGRETRSGVRDSGTPTQDLGKRKNSASADDGEVQSKKSKAETKQETVAAETDNTVEADKDDDDDEKEMLSEEDEKSTVTIVPRFAPTAKSKQTDSREKANNQGSEESGHDTTPQVVLSPTSKFITGKSGSKSQIFKLSIAPGSEGQLIQAGSTVKIGSTLLKITPKSKVKSLIEGRGDNTSSKDKEVDEDTDREEFVSSLNTCIDEFEILDDSMEDDDEDVSYPSVQQDTFFSAFGLVKKSELPKDGAPNKLHRLAGGKLRRTLKPNFAPGMVYKDGKIIIEDATDGSPRSKAKLLAKSLESGEMGSDSAKPKKREWLKPPPKKPSSPHKEHRESSSVRKIDFSKKSEKSSGKSRSHDLPLKKHSSFPGEKSKEPKKPSRLTKAKSEDDIDLNMLPFRRSSRQRDSKRKEWKHLLRANPDEFEEDPQWLEDMHKTRQRSETRLAKKLEREKKEEAKQKYKFHDVSSEEESGEDEDKTGEKSDKSQGKLGKKKDDKEKQISYAEMYEGVVLKRSTFNRIKRHSEWKQTKRILDEQQRKLKQKIAEAGNKRRKVVTQDVGVYEGVSWEVSSLEASPVKEKPVETVVEEITAPNGEVIQIKVEKCDQEESEAPKSKSKKRKLKDPSEEAKTQMKSPAKKGEKVLMSPKFIKMPVKLGSSVESKPQSPFFATPTGLPPAVRNAPVIVILGADGKPLPPTRTNILCEKIRSTLEEVVQKPEMLNKGKVLELKVPRYKLLSSSDKEEREKLEKAGETSPSHQSFLPFVSVKSDYHRELECQMPHMCNICWVNDHMYCKHMKRLPEQLPCTGGCLHFVPCGHYRHLDDTKYVNRAKYLSLRKWQGRLADKYFAKAEMHDEEEKENEEPEEQLQGDLTELEDNDLELVEDEEGNFVAVNTEGWKVNEAVTASLSQSKKTAELDVAGKPAEDGNFTLSQDSGYHSELPDSQNTIADTSLENIGETVEFVQSQEQAQVPSIEVTSHEKTGTESEDELADLLCDESFHDSDAEGDLLATPPAGTELLHVQIRARAQHIARSLVFDDATLYMARPFAENEAAAAEPEVQDEEDDPEYVPLETHGAAVTIGGSSESDEEHFIKTLLYPDQFPAHYEFVHDKNRSHSDLEETSDFIDIRGRKHRVIKVHIAKLDDETRGELMKSLVPETGSSRTPETASGFSTKRKRRDSDGSDDSDGEAGKRASPQMKKGLMQKSDVHPFSFKTQTATRGPLAMYKPKPSKGLASPTKSEESEKSTEKKGREKPLSMQPIKINSTEAELPQELQDQSTSGEDGSQVLTFTTKEIREKKPELLAYIKRAGLAPVIADKLKAEKASIEKMVKDAEAQLLKLQDSMGEHKLLQRALCGEIKTVKQELQDMQLVVVEDEAMAAKLRIKKGALENRRRYLEKRRDNCTQSIRHLIHFHAEGKFPEWDSDEETGGAGEEAPSEGDVSKGETSEEQQGSTSAAAGTPRSIQQSVAPPVVSEGKQMPSSPPQVQRVTTPPAVQQQKHMTQTVQIPLQQLQGNSANQQQFLQIVDDEGKTQLLQLVGNSADQQVYELVSTCDQQTLLKPSARDPQRTEQVIQYVTDSEQTQFVGGEEQVQEQIIISDGSLRHEQFVEEEHVITEEQLIYTTQDEDPIVVRTGPQHEQVILTEGNGEQVVVTEYPQDHVVEEVVLSDEVSVPAHHVTRREVVVAPPSGRVAAAKPTLQSLLRKQPVVSRSRPVSVLKPHLQQQLSGMQQVIIVTQPAEVSNSQTIYAVPSSSHTAVVSSAAQRVGDSSQVVQGDNIIETAFVAATQDGETEELVEPVGSSARVAMQVAKQQQPQLTVQQQQQQQQNPAQQQQQQHVIVTQHGHGSESMNIDDIDVQPLQTSQEDMMRIASELLGVSSIDLAP